MFPLLRRQRSLFSPRIIYQRAASTRIPSQIPYTYNDRDDPSRPPGRVSVFWDLDNKPPPSVPPYDAAVRLREVAAGFGHLEEMVAYANKHAFSYVPAWVREERRHRKELDTLEEIGLHVPDQPYVCTYCGRKCRTNVALKRHFKQLHEREREKRMRRLESLRGKRRQKFIDSLTEKEARYRDAARGIITPKSGYGLMQQLKQAGVQVQMVPDEPQAADQALKKHMGRSIQSGTQCICLVSDDSDFGPVLQQAQAMKLHTVVVGDTCVLKNCADVQFSWADLASGRAFDRASELAAHWHRGRHGKDRCRNNEKDLYHEHRKMNIESSSLLGAAFSLLGPSYDLLDADGSGTDTDSDEIVDSSGYTDTDADEVELQGSPHFVSRSDCVDTDLFEHLDTDHNGIIDSTLCAEYTNTDSDEFESQDFDSSHFNSYQNFSMADHGDADSDKNKVQQYSDSNSFGYMMDFDGKLDDVWKYTDTGSVGNLDDTQPTASIDSESIDTDSDERVDSAVYTDTDADEVESQGSPHFVSSLDLSDSDHSEYIPVDNNEIVSNSVIPGDISSSSKTSEYSGFIFGDTAYKEFESWDFKSSEYSSMHDCTDTDSDEIKAQEYDDSSSSESTETDYDGSLEEVWLTDSDVDYGL